MSSRAGAKTIKRGREVTRSLAKKSIFRFLDEVKAEFARLTWTKREDLMVYTKVVLVMTFLFGMSVYGIDLFIQSALSSVNVVLSYVTG